jgi:hypothetical protein
MIGKLKVGPNAMIAPRMWANRNHGSRFTNPPSSRPRSASARG